MSQPLRTLRGAKKRAGRKETDKGRVVNGGVFDYMFSLGTVGTRITRKIWSAGIELNGFQQLILLY